MNQFTKWFNHFNRWEKHIEHQKKRKQLIQILAIIFFGSLGIGIISGFVYSLHQKQTIISVAKEISESESSEMNDLVNRLEKIR